MMNPDIATARRRFGELMLQFSRTAAILDGLTMHCAWVEEADYKHFLADLGRMIDAALAALSPALAEIHPELLERFCGQLLGGLLHLLAGLERRDRQQAEAGARLLNGWIHYHEAHRGALYTERSETMTALTYPLSLDTVEVTRVREALVRARSDEAAMAALN